MVSYFHQVVPGISTSPSSQSSNMASRAGRAVDGAREKNASMQKDGAAAISRGTCCKGVSEGAVTIGPEEKMAESGDTAPRAKRVPSAC